MSAPLPEGTLFAGRYRIVRMIAQGGMGAVYEVVHTETNRHRALKIMHPHLFQSDDLRERFKREARIAAEIESEHIVDVSDAGIDEATQTPFMVMELLRGEELGKRIKRAGRFQYGEALIYLRQTAFALDRTHEANIVHRDLKPDNLFYTQRDDGTPRIKILDFGVAKIVADGATGQATQSLGTPLYMAPEQFLPGAKITPAADIFALGMLAFTMLVGVPYWRPESTTAGGIIPFVTIAVRGPQEPAVRRAATLGVALPPAFDAWFARATAQSPADRYFKAIEAISALERVFAEASMAVLEVTVPLPVRPLAPSVAAFVATPGTLGPLSTTPAAIPVPLPTPTNLPNEASTRPPPRKTMAPLFAGVAILGVLGIAGLFWLQREFARDSPSAAEASASPLSALTTEATRLEPAPPPPPTPVVSIAAPELSAPEFGPPAPSASAVDKPILTTAASTPKAAPKTPVLPPTSKKTIQAARPQLTQD